MIGPTNALTVTGTVDPGSVTVGSNLKPVKLVNGVATAVDNDLVSTVGAQIIGDTKTFTNALKVNADIGMDVTAANANFVKTTTSTTEIWAHTTRLYDHAGNLVSKHAMAINSGACREFIGVTSPNGNIEAGLSIYASNTNRWINAPNLRQYNASNVNDVLTIGALQASIDVVHRSGDENIGGNKTFSSIIYSRLIRGNPVTNINGVVYMFYNVGGLPTEDYNIEVNLEVNGRNHWEICLLKIYKDGVTMSRLALPSTYTQSIIRVYKSSTEVFIGMQSSSNDFPNMQIKYCQFRGSARNFSNVALNITDDANYTQLPITII